MDNVCREVINANTTFNDRELLTIVVSLFPEKALVDHGMVQLNADSVPPYSVYSQIEDTIFDLRSQCQDPERKEFLELLEIMSWSVFRVWSRHIAELSDISQEVFMPSLDKDEMLRLFWENLSCDEGAPLRDRMRRGFAE